MALSESDIERIGTLLGPDTPPRGIKVDLEQGLAIMSHLGAFPGLIEFIRGNSLYQASEREAYFNKAAGDSQDTIAYKVGIFEGSDQPLKVFSVWNLRVRHGHTYQDLRIGFFSTNAWTKALESAELHTQLEEPDASIRSGDPLWYMREKYWASDIHAEPRHGDIIPAVGVDLNQATSGLIVQRDLQVFDYHKGPEAQAIRPIVLTFRENLQKALSAS